MVKGSLSEGDAKDGFFRNFANRAELRPNEVRNGGEKCLFVCNSDDDLFRANRFAGCRIGVHFTAGSLDRVACLAWP
ncbi:MAG: NosD domain-containing protein [Paracoccaceae bacterium]